MSTRWQAEFLLKTYKDGSNPWVRRLVDTRSITMLPMSNAIGYDKIVREENHVDPNRDFPCVLCEAGCVASIACPDVASAWLALL